MCFRIDESNKSEPYLSKPINVVFNLCDTFYKKTNDIVPPLLLLTSNHEQILKKKSKILLKNKFLNIFPTKPNEDETRNIFNYTKALVGLHTPLYLLDLVYDYFENQDEDLLDFDEANLLKRPQLKKETLQLFNYINDNIIGGNEHFFGPYGRKKIIYCDYIASGKSLSFIEDYIQENVMSTYANTHTTTSRTGLQSTLFREESRNIIRSCLNCKEDDVLIFNGSGATSCVTQLVHLLRLQYDHSCHTSDPKHFSFVIKELGETEEDIEKWQAFVLIGAFEHHSNILPWRETGCKWKIAETDSDGRVDYVKLEKTLKKYGSLVDKVNEKHKNDKPGTWKKILKIGSFSAGSNVSGIQCNILKITKLLHQYGFLCFFDYACSAPYSSIDMNPNPKNEVFDDYLNPNPYSKDAIFLSTHKFIGGPQTPGILIVKKKCFRTALPSKPGGGTVKYVSVLGHSYLKDPSHREEGGTPEIIGSIRAGLVFQLKSVVGDKNIEEIELYYLMRAMQSIVKNSNIEILGNPNLPRLGVLSFIINFKQAATLHYGFVSALLNDLFGIQTRGGCMCAGPYVADLIGIGPDNAQKMGEVIENHPENEIVKPGFCRLSFNYFFDEPTYLYVIRAIHFVANQGYKFLPFYTPDLKSGAWIHKDFTEIKERRFLKDISYESGEMEFFKQTKVKSYNKKELSLLYHKYLSDAEKFAQQAEEIVKCSNIEEFYQYNEFDKDAEYYRAFWWPREVAKIIKGEKIDKKFNKIYNLKYRGLFHPKKLEEELIKIKEI